MPDSVCLSVKKLLLELQFTLRLGEMLTVELTVEVTVSPTVEVTVEITVKLTVYQRYQDDTKHPRSSIKHPLSGRRSKQMAYA